MIGGSRFAALTQVSKRNSQFEFCRFHNLVSDLSRDEIQFCTEVVLQKLDITQPRWLGF